VDIAQGKTSKVSFTLSAKELGFYDEDGNWLLEAGAFRIFVGPNSRDVLEADLILK